MKLISSRSKGRHVLKANAKNSAKAKASNIDTSTTSAEKKKKRSGRLSTKKKVLISLASVFGLMLLLGTSVFAVVRWQVQPFYDHFFRPGLDALANNPISVAIIPGSDSESDSESSSDSETPARPNVDNTVSDNRDNGDTESVENTRNVDMFTFLILGIDDYANTDVIMVATFDTAKSTLEVVSIPRDTLVNVSWGIKKANSIMAMMQHRYRNEEDTQGKAMQATVEHFRNLLGFEVDFWVTLNPNAFIRLVDAVGPIEFNVPADIYEYGVRVSRGTQRLNGIQALTVMRARRVYADGDFGRVNTQHNFMNAIATQVLARRDSISITDYANIFIGNVRTNIQLNHLVWLGRELLRLDANDINFSTMPVSSTMVRGVFYATIHLDEWLEIVNDKLSPLPWEITAEDVSILTWGPDRRLFVTDDNWQGTSGWGR